MRDLSQPRATFPIQAYARIAGVLYLVVILIGLCSELLIRQKLIAWGDAQATAQHILGAQSLWRLGVAGEDVLLICALGMSIPYYLMLRIVSKPWALAALLFSTLSLAVESVSALHLHAVLGPLTDPAFQQAADPRLAKALAYQSVQGHFYAYVLALTFFGVECLINGHLIRQSGFFPKVFGTLLQVAGVSYLINSFSAILFPSLQSVLVSFLLLLCFVCESAFCLRLLIKGVDVTAWHQRALHAHELEVVQ